jgi:hypothetical protein
MRASIRKWTLLALLAAAPAAVQAQAKGPAAAPAATAAPTGLGGWSVVGAETVQSGKPVVDIQAGWPSTNFGYTFALSPTNDVSLRFGLLYGFEGTTTDQFGLAFYAPLRFDIARADQIRILFHVDPGIRFYTTEPGIFGFAFPVGLVFGLPIQPGLELGLGLDFNMTLVVTGNFSPRFFFGPALGPYFEYHIDPRMAFGINTRFGAAIDAYSAEGPIPGGTATHFAFTTQLFFGYRL